MSKSAGPIDVTPATAAAAYGLTPEEASLQFNKDLEAGVTSATTQQWTNPTGPVTSMRQTLRRYKGPVADLVPPPTPSVPIELPDGVTGSCGAGMPRESDGVSEPYYGACALTLTAEKTTIFISTAGSDRDAVADTLTDVARRTLAS